MHFWQKLTFHLFNISQAIVQKYCPILDVLNFAQAAIILCFFTKFCLTLNGVKIICANASPFWHQKCGWSKVLPLAKSDGFAKIFTNENGQWERGLPFQSEFLARDKRYLSKKSVEEKGKYFKDILQSTRSLTNKTFCQSYKNFFE